VDGYYRSATDTFKSVFASTITQIRHLTNDPILIAETGVEQVPAAGAQVASLFAGVRADRLRGFIWFDAKGTADWRLEDNHTALTAFRNAAKRFRP